MSTDACEGPSKKLVEAIVKQKEKFEKLIGKNETIEQ